jgi:hypothetical protein
VWIIGRDRNESLGSRKSRRRPGGGERRGQIVQSPFRESKMASSEALPILPCFYIVLRWVGKHCEFYPYERHKKPITIRMKCTDNEEWQKAMIVMFDSWQGPQQIRKTQSYQVGGLPIVVPSDRIQGSRNSYLRTGSCLSFRKPRVLPICSALWRYRDKTKSLTSRRRGTRHKAAVPLGFRINE